MSRIFSRVAGETRGNPRTARETVAVETPAAAATSSMLTPLWPPRWDLSVVRATVSPLQLLCGVGPAGPAFTPALYFSTPRAGSGNRSAGCVGTHHHGGGPAPTIPTCGRGVSGAAAPCHTGPAKLPAVPAPIQGQAGQ